jgi:hypothetical protein
MLCTHPLTLAENVIRIDFIITKSNLAKFDHGHIFSHVCTMKHKTKNQMLMLISLKLSSRQISEVLSPLLHI